MIDTHNIEVDFGRYSGQLLTRIPPSYLQWAITNGIEKKLKTPVGRFKLCDLAEAELKRRGERTQTIDITAHAIDRFSTRYLAKFMTEAQRGEGLFSYLERMASSILEFVEKDEENDAEVKIKYDRVTWCLDMSKALPILKTVM